MAEMTALQIAQEFARRQGLPQPLSLVSASDDTTQQIWGLMNEGIMDLADRYHWQELHQDYSFNHACLGGFVAIDFTTSTSLAGFKALIMRTLWDTTSRIEVNGPLSEPEWMTLLTMRVSSARYSYRIFGGTLQIYPYPGGGYTIPAPIPLTPIFRMNYLSKYGVLNPGTLLPSETYIADTDKPRLPSRIILADLKWRWRKEKGLPYAEDQRVCEEMVLNAVSREPHAPIVLDKPDQPFLVGPGLLVPAGSWQLP